MRPGLRRVMVRGPSMAPTLSDGDVVLVRFGAAARPGDLVLVRWAARPSQLSVKRARSRVADGRWLVYGDNPYGSTDSRTLGPAMIVGVVLARLWPRPRQLRLRRLRRLRLGWQRLGPAGRLRLLSRWVWPGRRG